MDVVITVTGDDAAENLRALRTWLVEEPELRGRVRLVERPPEPGQLGSIPDLISVALNSGATVLATAVIAWLRYRTSDVTCTFTKSDGTSFTVSAKRVRSSDMTAQQQLVRDSLTKLTGATESETPRAEQ